MRTRDAARLLRQLAAEAERAATLVEERRPMLLGWVDTHLASSSGGVAVTVSGHSSPTEAAATARVKDGHRHILVELDRQVVAVSGCLGGLFKTLDKITVEDTTRPENLGEKGCRLCGAVRVRGVNAQGHTVDRGSHPNSFQPVWLVGEQLCRWCTDFTNDYGMEPNDDMLAWHLENPSRKRTAVVVKNLQPGAYAARHRDGFVSVKPAQFGVESLEHDAEGMA